MHAKKIYIFEGIDGSGKTTAAKAFATMINARYVHFSAMPKVENGLARMYVEAMLPALLGYQSVVFDRSWLSEGPYGSVFRNGSDRIGVAQRRILERIAMRCGAVVIYCDPGFENVKRSFVERRKFELLNSTVQLEYVYGLYSVLITDLPSVNFDYTVDSIRNLQIPDYRSHNLLYSTVGNIDATYLIVGDGSTTHKDDQPFYQLPFTSLCKHDNNVWLTEQLAQSGISEIELMWTDIDVSLSHLYYVELNSKPKVIALGRSISDRLVRENVPHKILLEPYFSRPYSNPELRKKFD